MTSVAVRGAGLEVVERGSGPPVVLIHGSSHDHRMWRPTMDRWSDRYRVIAYSRRYHGPNDPIAPGATYALDDHVDDLRTLLRTLEVDGAPLIGHSYGGLVGLVLAARSPGTVGALVAIEPPVLGLYVSVPPRPLELLRLALRHPLTAAGILKLGVSGLGPAKAALRGGDEDEAIRRLGTAVLGEEAFRELDPERVELIRDNLIPEELESPEAFPPMDPSRLATLRSPILLVGGERSPAVFGYLLDRLEELLPNAERLTLEGASHLVQEDRPERFHEAVDAFLERHDAAR